jgi:hypothetical protein
VDPARLGEFFELASELPLLAGAVLLALLVSGFEFIGYRNAPGKRPKTSRALLMLLAIGIVSMTGSLAAASMIGLPASLSVRYLQPLIVLPVALMAIVAAASLRPRWQWALVSAVAVFGLGTLAAKGRNFDAAAFAPPRPELVQCLDRLAGLHGFEHGYAGYWQSKPVGVLSSAGVRANAVWRDIVAWHMTNNDAWLAKRPSNSSGGFPRYEFIVARDDATIVPLFPAPGVSTVRGRFGPEAAQYRCGEHRVLVYDRPEDVAFRNRLRLRALFEIPAGMRKGPGKGPGTRMAVLPTSVTDAHPSGVVCAEGHDIYTGEEAAPEAAGIVPLPERRGHELVFDAPLRRGVLELAVRADHAYRMRFFRGEELLGRLDVPAAAEPSLRIHYLALPPAVRDRGFDRAVLAREPAGPTRVGHICFYPDSAE